MTQTTKTRSRGNTQFNEQKIPSVLRVLSEEYGHNSSKTLGGDEAIQFLIEHRLCENEDEAHLLGSSLVEKGYLECTKNKTKTFEANKKQYILTSKSAEATKSALEKYPKLKNLVNNCKSCVDCDCKEAVWASVNLGVLMCLKCSGVHRQLGTHISRVRSITLDLWTDKYVNNMMDNNEFNKIWEYYVPNEYVKPNEYSKRELRQKYIFNKYGKNIKDNKYGKNTKGLFHKDTNTSKKPLAPKYDNANKTSEDESKSSKGVGMIEYNGVLSINLISGKNFPKADLLSDSDPYCVFDSGTQKVKSKIIQDNNNPIWNDNIILSVKEDIPVKIFVYDFDKLTNDDLLAYGTFNINKLLENNKEKSFDSFELNMIKKYIKKNSKTNNKCSIKFKATYTKMQ